MRTGLLSQDIFIIGHGRTQYERLACNKLDHYHYLDGARQSLQTLSSLMSTQPNNPQARNNQFTKNGMREQSLQVQHL
jgi:hypothetical protein